MKQITNLQETIYNDKLAVEEINLKIKTLEKQLHFAKGILSAHEKALERMLSPEEYSPCLVEKVPQSITEKLETPTNKVSSNRVRITLENWKDLGIKVGDEVEIVVSGDADFYMDEGNVVDVLDVESTLFNGTTFLRLSCRKHRPGSWYHYERNCDESEIYLIRTKEGSLKE